MTPKQIYIIDVPIHSVESAKLGDEGSKDRLKRLMNGVPAKRVAQDRLILAQPVEVVDLEELSK